MIELAGRYGVWRLGAEADAGFAEAVERAGYTSLWLGAVTADDLGRTPELLDATTDLVVATGIVNIWTITAEAAAEWFHRSESTHPGRVVLGIGAGHREAQGPAAATPFEAMGAYADDLIAAGVAADRIVMAALGPRVLRLAGERTAGAHPYLTTPEHTRAARELVGAGKLVVPEQHVALGAGRDATRRTARAALEFYLGLTNYRNSWLRLGFTEADLSGGGSDALVDALVAQGSPAAIAAHLREHLDAGADHVVVQALGDDPAGDLAVLARELGL